MVGCQVIGDLSKKREMENKMKEIDRRCEENKFLSQEERKFKNVFKIIVGNFSIFKGGVLESKGNVERKEYLVYNGFLRNIWQVLVVVEIEKRQESGNKIRICRGKRNRLK